MEIGKWIKKWRVNSNSGNGEYTVSLSDKGVYGCSCPAWKFRRQECSHIKFIKKNNPPPSDELIECKLPICIPAKVFEPILEDGKILYPLVPMDPSATHMMATIVWFMMENGYTFAKAKEVYQHIPSQWTKSAIYAHIEKYGKAKYLPTYYSRVFGVGI